MKMTSKDPITYFLKFWQDCNMKISISKAKTMVFKEKESEQTPSLIIKL